MARYKVGDLLEDLDDGKNDRKVLIVDEREYFIEYNDGNNNWVTHSIIEKNTKLATKEIKATKIARKVYQDRIISEKAGLLTVRWR